MQRSIDVQASSWDKQSKSFEKEVSLKKVYEMPGSTRIGHFLGWV